MRKRAAGNGGFTLIEMLAALAVMALLTGIVAMGTTAATHAYGVERFASQADVLSGEIENALAAEYRYTTSESPELFVSAEGRFVLVRGSAERDLLNSSAYGDCRVSFTGGVSSLKPVRQEDGSFVIEGTYVISSKRGSNTSPREYSFYFKSYGDTLNGQAFGGINSSSSGGSGGSGGAEEELNQARADLAALIEAAQSITQGNKTWDAFQQLQGAIATAEGWRDNNDATKQQLVDAKAALQQAIEVFNNSATESEEAELTSFEITLSPSADGNAYSLGTTGVRATARAEYSDGTFSESATWSSSNPSIVSVDNGGNLTFHAVGSAVITAAIGEDSEDVTVTVESGQHSGETFTITVGGQTYSTEVEEYDGSGVLTAGTVYSSNGSYYYVNKDINDPSNTDLEARSWWDYNYGGVAKVTEDFVDASAFTANGGTQCPTTINKGTLYYDSANGKLYSCYRDQAWMSRPDYNAGGWNDVSGLISG